MRSRPRSSFIVTHEVPLRGSKVIRHAVPDRNCDFQTFSSRAAGADFALGILGPDTSAHTQGTGSLLRPSCN
jgi:hypothetical protein